MSIEEKWREWIWKELLRKNNAKLRWLSSKTSSLKNAESKNSFSSRLLQRNARGSLTWRLRN